MCTQHNRPQASILIQQIESCDTATMLVNIHKLIYILIQFEQDTVLELVNIHKVPFLISEVTKPK